jgi:hypothetical protein
MKIMESFRDMISKDDKFVFSGQVDDDNLLKSLMWTSGRIRSLYERFGDAITFDTTYETNICIRCRLTCLCELATILRVLYLMMFCLQMRWQPISNGHSMNLFQ